VEVVGQDMHAETYTLYLRLPDSDAAYDLELALPGYVYHRLELESAKSLTVELRRQNLHVMHRQDLAASKT
jgi:hypothetical protein